MSHVLHDVEGDNILGQERSPRSQQLTPGRQQSAVALTLPATQGMWGPTLQVTPPSQQGSTGPSLYLGDNSNSRGAAPIRGANGNTPAFRSGIHTLRSKKASRMGGGTTTALANALSGIR